MKKRKWIYIHHPTSYEIRCDKCWDGDIGSGKGTNIDWSEYEGCIWCYDCEEDRAGFGGVFDGPIAIEIFELLGLTFWRYYLKSKKIMKPIETKDGHLIYRQCSKAELSRLKKVEHHERQSNNRD